MTDRRDSPDSDGNGREDLDEIQPVSSSLRPAQADRGESEASEPNAQEPVQSESGKLRSENTDELDELVSVSSSLRPGQGRTREEDAECEGDGDD